MGVVIQMPNRGGSHIDELRDAKRKAIEAEGSRSLGRLMRVRKLKVSDRESIAHELYKYVERVFDTHSDLMRGKFACDANLCPAGEETSKEIWRLTLAPDDNNVQKLRASGRNYALLIKAIAKILKLNVHIVTDTITYGSAVHPVKYKYREVNQKLLAAIQQIANMVDTKNGLLKKFSLIADKKYELQKAGGLCDWPFYDYDESDTEDEEIVNPNQNITDPMYSYWRPDVNWTEVDPDSIAQLPHIHLGMFWDEESWSPAEQWGSVWGEDNYTREFLDAVEKFKQECGDIEDSEIYMKKRKEYLDIGSFKDKTLFDAVPREVLVDKTTNRPVYRDRHGLMANLDYWLVLYPNNEMTAVEPILWSHGGDYAEGMMNMQSLNLRVLEEMKQIQVISRSNETLYDRLIQVMGVSKSDTGIECQLFREWNKTANYIETCPIWSYVQRDLDINKTLDRILISEEVSRDE